MTKLTITPPSTGELNTVADPKVVTALQAIEAWANGSVGTNNIEAGSVTEAMLSTAVQTLLGKAVSGLTFAERTTSVEAASGELVYANKTAITITLPAPTVGRSIAVFCGGSATSVKVTCSSGKIYGDFTEGATTVTLTTYQHLRVVASGEHWFIESGEPKKEAVYSTGFKAYSEAEAVAGVAPSATRMAYVVFKGGSGSLEIGGVKMLNLSGGVVTMYLIPPGQKWKSNAALETQTLLL